MQPFILEYYRFTGARPAVFGSPVLEAQSSLGCRDSVAGAQDRSLACGIPADRCAVPEVLLFRYAPSFSSGIELSRRFAAVDEVGSSRDEGGLVGGNENDSLSNLFGFSHAL